MGGDGDALVQGAMERILKMKQAISWRQEERRRNAEGAARRPDEEELKQRESFFKKCTALVRKLGKIQDGQQDAVVREIRGTNLTRYVTECVKSIAECTFKSKDLPAVVAACGCLHQDYASFSPQVLQALLSPFMSTQALREAIADRSAHPRLRTMLRTLATLVSVGCNGDSVKPLILAARSLTTQAVGVSRPEGRDDALAALSALQALCRAVDVAFLTDARQVAFAAMGAAAADAVRGGDTAVEAAVAGAVRDLQEERQKAWRVPEADSQAMAELLEASLAATREALLQDHRELRRREMRNTRIMTERGDLPERMVVEYRQQRERMEALVVAEEGLREAMGREKLELPEEPEGRIETETGTVIINAGFDASRGGALGPWEDEAERAFHEDLPDLLQMVPQLLVKLKGKPGGESESGESDGGEEEDSSGDEKDGEEEAGGDQTGDQAAKTGSTAAGAKAAAQGSSRLTASQLADALGADEYPDSDYDSDGAGGPGQGRGRGRGRGGPGAAPRPLGPVESLVRDVDACSTSAQCDAWCARYCVIDSKGNRRRLVRALARPSRAAGHALPSYARVTASLARVWPEVGTAVGAAVVQWCRKLRKANDPSAAALEPRVRSARYLGELTCFRCAPAGDVFRLLWSCLEGFHKHNVDVVCALLETCGRYLARLPETQQRLDAVVEEVSRRKSRGLEPRHDGLVDAALFAVRPPKRHSQRWRRPHVLEAWTLHLLHEELGSAEDVQDVAGGILSLPWGQEEGGVGAGQAGSTEGGNKGGAGAGQRGDAQGRNKGGDGSEGDGSRKGAGGVGAEGAREELPTGHVLEEMVVEALAGAAVERFTAVRLVADVVAAVGKGEEAVAIGVVDACVEGVVGSVERGGKDHQRRIALARLLGHLVVRHVCDSATFKSILGILLTMAAAPPAADAEPNPLPAAPGPGPSTTPDLSRNWSAIRAIVALLQSGAPALSPTAPQQSKGRGRGAGRRGPAATSRTLQATLLSLLGCSLALGATPIDVAADIEALLAQHAPQLRGVKTAAEARNMLDKLQAKAAGARVGKKGGAGAGAGGALTAVEEEGPESDEESSEEEDGEMGGDEAEEGDKAGDAAEEGARAAEQLARQREIDEEFERDFRELMLEGTGSANTLGIPAAVQHFGSSVRIDRRMMGGDLDDEEDDGDREGDDEEEGSVGRERQMMGLKMLSRGGRGPREIMVPVTNRLAQGVLLHEAEMEKERQEIKRLVLDAASGMAAADDVAAGGGAGSWGAGRGRGRGRGRGGA